MSIMSLVNSLSPESAYASKPNILYPGTAVQAIEATKQAAGRQADFAALSQDTVSVTGAQITLTKNIKR